MAWCRRTWIPKSCSFKISKIIHSVVCSLPEKNKNKIDNTIFSFFLCSSKCTPLEHAANPIYVISFQFLFSIKTGKSPTCFLTVYRKKRLHTSVTSESHFATIFYHRSCCCSLLGCLILWTWRRWDFLRSISQCNRPFDVKFNGSFVWFFFLYPSFSFSVNLFLVIIFSKPFFFVSLSFFLYLFFEESYRLYNIPILLLYSSILLFSYTL